MQLSWTCTDTAISAGQAGRMTRYIGAARGGTARQGGPGTSITLVEVTIAHGLERSAVPALSVQLDKIVALRPERLVIDLTDCPFIDAAAIGLLLDVHRRLWLLDGLLSLRSPTPRLRRILHAARVDHVLHVTPETVTVLAEYAELADEVDVSRARNALERADSSEPSGAAAAARANARLKAAGAAE